MLTDEVFSDEQCAVLAISIAVSCRDQPKATNSSMARCESTPTDLDLLCTNMRRSPTQSRHRFGRRRPSAPKVCAKPRPRAAPLDDLSALDFALAEPLPERDAKKSKIEPWSLDLNDHDVGAKGVAKLTRALTSNTLSFAATHPLVCVQMAHNQLGDSGLASIVSAAMRGYLTSVERLILTGNRIANLDGFSEACAAGRLPSLRFLSLASNSLTTRSIGRLASATLADGCGALVGLKQLRLENNLLGGSDEEAHHVGAIIAACPSLSTLELGSNDLRDIHLRSLIDGIQRGDCFCAKPPEQPASRLDVSLNAYTHACFRELADACDAHGGVRAVC